MVNGRTDAEDMERQYQLASLRDTFAAAALTGLLAAPTDKDRSMDYYGILRSWLIRLRPEWESQSYAESNEKRMNTTMNRDATPSEGSVQEMCTLTESEREAIAGVAGFLHGLSETGIKAGTCQVLVDHAATLRSLLARLA